MIAAAILSRVGGIACADGGAEKPRHLDQFASTSMIFSPIETLATWPAVDAIKSLSVSWCVRKEYLHKDDVIINLL